MERFDVAVGLRAAGVDAGVAGAEPVEGGGERPLNSLPLSESARSSRQSARRSSWATRRANRLVCAAVGFWPGQTTSSAHPKALAISVAVSCQIAPWVPRRRPT